MHCDIFLTYAFYFIFHICIKEETMKRRVIIIILKFSFQYVSVRNYCIIDLFGKKKKEKLYVKY